MNYEKDIEQECQAEEAYGLQNEPFLFQIKLKCYELALEDNTPRAPLQVAKEIYEWVME